MPIAAAVLTSNVHCHRKDATRCQQQTNHLYAQQEKPATQFRCSRQKKIATKPNCGQQQQVEADGKQIVQRSDYAGDVSITRKLYHFGMANVLSYLLQAQHHMIAMRAVNVRHHRVGETEEPAIYRINDDLAMVMVIVDSCVG
ncbi:hypothetical protein Tco_0223851 [Tanacetum coccineum]